MMELVKYENHLGDTICLNEKPYKILDIDELFKIDRDYNIQSGSLVSFEQQLNPKQMEMDVLDTKSIRWKEAAERMQQIFELDVLMQHPGKLYVGDYYIPCYVYTAAPKNVNLKSPYVTYDLTLVSDIPVWMKAMKHSFLSSLGANKVYTTKRYSYSYPYRYRSTIGSSFLYNPLAVPSHYQIIFYGAVNNPAVVINNHVYQVNAEIMENEYLIVDYSGEQTRLIELHKRDGSVEDKFHCRSKESSVFTKIEPGKQAVNWSGDFAFDIILYEERSQPKWI